MKVAPNSTWRFWPLLWPLAFALHLAEEWFGGFGAWTLRTFGREVAAERFALINGIGWSLTLGAAAIAIARPRKLVPITALAALFVLNGGLHALASVGFGTYSPGTFTGLLLYLPLGAATLARAAALLTTAQWRGAVLAGVALHALVALAAVL